MGKLSYFMKQKDRTNNNYTTYKKQHVGTSPKIKKVMIIPNIGNKE